MKALVIAALTLAGSASFAMPSIGDSATYNVTQTISGQVVTFTMTQTITAYDAPTLTFTETQTTVYNGQTSTQNRPVKAADLPTDTQISQLIAQCASPKGTLETVTVPAGTFNTCKMADSSNGTAYNFNAGAVAFGIVRYESNDASGNHMLIELTASHVN